jgi:hypothetical protein
MSSGGNNTGGQSTLQQLVDESGVLTNPDLPGVNYVKQQTIISYVDGFIKGQGLDPLKTQVYSKDTGTDIFISIYYNNELYSQIYYSQINQPA